MKLDARLYAVDGAVFCPRDVQWTDVDHCRECEFVRTDETAQDGRVVVCRPEVDSYVRTLEAVIHT